jgi:hypothetical protein
MSAAFRFDPVELPPTCEALRGEVREFIAGELAAGLGGRTAISAVIGRRRSAGGSARAAGSG